LLFASLYDIILHKYSGQQGYDIDCPKEQDMVQQAQVTLVSPSGVAIRPLLESALRSESKMIELGLARTRRILRDFEQRYGMSTPEFYRRLVEDELQESLDFIEWAGEYKTLLKLQEKRQALQEIQFAH
jgi:hypothetical protein